MPKHRSVMPNKFEKVKCQKKEEEEKNVVVLGLSCGRQKQFMCPERKLK